MFQQNGRRTRGSASTTRRVVYLKHTIPPSPSLSFSLFLSRFSSLLPIHQRQDQRRGDVRVRERERERERERNDDRKMRGANGGVEGERVERRSTTTLGNQPPLWATPFSFSFRVVYRGMEDGKPATVRELTTFFRFSRRGGCAERAVGVAGGRVEKMGREEGRSSRSRAARRSRERRHRRDCGR